MDQIEPWSSADGREKMIVDAFEFASSWGQMRSDFSIKAHLCEGRKFHFGYFFVFTLSAGCFWNIPGAKCDSCYQYSRHLCNVCSTSLNGWNCFAGLEWALKLLVKIHDLLDVVIWTHLVLGCSSWKVSGRWHFWTKVLVKIKCADLFKCWCR